MKNNQIVIRKLALPVMISALVMSGCSTMSEKTATMAKSDSDMIIVEKDKQISSLEASSPFLIFSLGKVGFQ